MSLTLSPDALLGAPEAGAAAPTNAQVLAADRSSVFHSWSAQAGFAGLPIAGGQGSVVWDFDGKRYLDFSSQLVFTNLGHQHPTIVAAIQEQAAKLTTIAPAHANETRPGGSVDHRPRAGRVRQGVLHQRWR